MNQYADVERMELPRFGRRSRAWFPGWRDDVQVLWIPFLRVFPHRRQDPGETPLR